MNVLQFMLNKQTKFQNDLGHNFETMTIPEKSAYIKEMSLWVTDELHEMIHELPYAKHWSKKYESWDETKLNEQITLSKEEMIDSFLFSLNILVALGMNEDEIFDEYCKKNKINIERQETDY